MPTTNRKPYISSSEDLAETAPVKRGTSRLSNSPRAVAMRARKAERAASEARIAAAQAETAAIVATGKCPCCGAGLRRNLSITGWWQCDQYGAPGFRKDSSKPACDWQGFTAA